MRRRANEDGVSALDDRDDNGTEAFKRLAHDYRRRITRGGKALLTVVFVLAVAALSGGGFRGGGGGGGRDDAVVQTRWRAIRLTHPNPAAAGLLSRRRG